MKPFDEILQRVSTVSDLYGIDPELLATMTAELAAVPDFRFRVGMAAGYLNASIVGIAEVHREECQATACGTCEQIRSALPMVLAHSRIELDEQFQQQMKATGSGWRWPRFRALSRRCGL